jgi:o-succinylbenzoate---CoA ligase
VIELSVFEAARSFPDRDALIWQQTVWSYRQLAERVFATTEVLVARGVRCNDRVAVCANNQPDVVCALLALLEIGATAVLVHPKLTLTEIDAQIADARPSLVLEVPHCEVLSGEPGSAIAHTPDTTAVMLYTSGTSGRPKGAMLSRRALVASARASEKKLRWYDNDRWLLCLPVCHIGGFSVLTRSVMARRCVVLHERFDAHSVLASIEKERATLLSVVPTMLRKLLDAEKPERLSALRAVLVGGAATPDVLLQRCMALRVRALTTYGLTEACSQVTTQNLPASDAPFVVTQGSGSVLDGVEIRIVDDHHTPVAHGEIGSIEVRGETLMDGYWGSAPLGAQWLSTGDLGSLDSQGNLFVHARRTDLIVTGGENVYPAEIESVLVSLPGVSAAVVFGISDEQWGQVVAAVVLREEATHDSWYSESAAYLARRLAPHKRPRKIAVVSTLPTRATGKIDRLATVRDYTASLRAWE